MLIELHAYDVPISGLNSFLSDTKQQIRTRAKNYVETYLRELHESRDRTKSNFNLNSVHLDELNRAISSLRFEFTWIDVFLLAQTAYCSIKGPQNLIAPLQLDASDCSVWTNFRKPNQIADLDWLRRKTLWNELRNRHECLSYEIINPKKFKWELKGNYDKKGI